MSGTRGLPRPDLLPVPPVAPFGSGSGGGTVTPPNFIVGPVTEFAPGTVLPGGGAFGAGILFDWPITNVNGIGLRMQRVTHYIRYQRGAAGGYPIFRVTALSSPPAGFAGGAEFRIPLVDLTSIAVVAPDASLNFYREELKGPAPADDVPIDYELTYVLPAGARGTRLYIAEGGVIATPGTVAVYAYGDG